MDIRDIKLEQEDLLIRVGETLHIDIEIFIRTLTIPNTSNTIVKGNIPGTIEIFLKTEHCLESCQTVVIRNVLSSSECKTLEGDYEITVTSDKSFTVKSDALDGDCISLCGGQIDVPIDLTGMQAYAQIRAHAPGSDYLPPIVGVSVSDQEAIAYMGCEQKQTPMSGYVRPKRGDLITIGDSVDPIFLVDVRSPGRSNRGTDLILSEVPAQAEQNKRMHLYTDAIADFSSIIEPKRGLIRLTLPEDKSEDLPIPYMSPHHLNAKRQQHGSRLLFGPFRWDCKLVSTSGSQWLREGDVWLSPSTTRRYA